MKHSAKLLSERAIKLSCRKLWKVYGSSHGEPFFDEAGVRRSLESSKAVAALRDANLDIRHGEIFVIMGLSGSGKSTLLRCLTRLVEPSFGNVVIDGKDFTSLDTKALMQVRRHNLAMVFQHFALLPHLNVADNIALPLKIRGSSAEEIARVVPEATALVGLSGMSDRLPHQLSGGQQQRVGLARALAGDPDLLFLDEPFSALDPLIRRELQQELLRLQARLHKTMVFVTHDFSEAVRLGDRIAIMSDGRIVQMGTPEEIVAEPADAYVASFVAGVDQTSVISCRRLASPARPVHYDVVVDGRRKIVEIAAIVAGANGAVGVRDEEGRICGEIESAAILRMMSAAAGTRVLP
ncbi:MAG: ATP-binding cassette domain-containing protein [Hyphomicrobium sp.]